MSTSITPTALRKNLFRTLRRVLRGETVIVRTEEGEAVLTALRRPGKPRSKADALKPKVPGRILGGLDTADKALREHLRLPE